MISTRTKKSIEFDKILSFVAEKAVLKKTKDNIIDFEPLINLKEVSLLLEKTRESYDLLYKFNVNTIYFIQDVEEQLTRAEKGGTMNSKKSAAKRYRFTLVELLAALALASLVAKPILMLVAAAQAQVRMEVLLPHLAVIVLAMAVRVSIRGLPVKRFVMAAVVAAVQVTIQRAIPLDVVAKAAAEIVATTRVRLRVRRRLELALPVRMALAAAVAAMAMIRI